jgi:hypothetical protein
MRVCVGWERLPHFTLTGIFGGWLDDTFVLCWPCNDRAGGTVSALEKAMESKFERTRRILSEVHFSSGVSMFCGFTDELAPYVVIDQASGLVLLSPQDVDKKHRWGPWQGALKHLAAVQQDFKCAKCGQVCSSGELHHALASKQDAGGWRDQDFLIHHSLNVVLVHPHCHSSLTREECYAFLCDLYGEDLVWNWVRDTAIRVQDTRLLSVTSLMSA